MTTQKSFFRILFVLAVGILLLFSGCDQPTSSVDDTDDQKLEQSTTDGFFSRGNNSDKKVRGSYIVVFKDDVKSVGSAANQMANRAGGNVKFKYEHSIKGFNLQLPPQAASNVIKALQKNPNVDYILPDLEVQKFDTQTNATWGLDRSDQRSLPLDSEFFSVKQDLE